MSYAALKALHIIFVVTWFAALFYMPRLFVYDVEARDKPESVREILLEQLQIMQKRLWYGIAWPSMVLTLILGSWLAVVRGYDPTLAVFNWLTIKIGLVALLVVYHIACERIMRRLRANDVPWGSQGMRMWNEVPTLLLFAVVFLVVYQQTEGLWWGVGGLLGLMVLLLAGIKGYRMLRQPKA
jgi:putative membrane protein